MTTPTRMRLLIAPLTSATLALALAPALSACSTSSSTTAHQDAAPLTKEAGSSHEAGGKTDAGMGRSDARADAPVDGGPPTLVSLSVAGAAGELVPAFSPDIHDYYVRCAATNQLMVAMTASPGALSSLLLPTASASAAKQTVAVSADAGQLIEAVATAGAASTDYWVRCLPPDFPNLQMTTYLDAGTTPGPGYYLVGVQDPPATVGEAAYAMILDGNGVPVWYSAPATSLTGVADVDSLATGEVSYDPAGLLASSPFVVENLSVSPPTTTTVAPVSSSHYTPDVHEVRMLPNGHYLTITYNVVGGIDLTGLVLLRAGDAGNLALGPGSYIQDCTVLEIDPTKSTDNVVWTWSASDHFEAKDVCTSPQTAAASDGVAPGGAATYDVFHCESIDIDPANGNLLVAARHMNSVFYIDKADTQKVLWKMGGKNSSKDNATFITVADPFDQQHDARLVAGWSSTCHGGTGQVSMFDDETTSGEVARGVVYDVVVGGSGSACPDGGAFDGGAPAPGTAINAWQYQGIHPSAGTGSMRISPDNTRIIGWGIFVGPVFTEVDVAKHKLREFSFASLDDSYRAIKVPLDTFDLPTLRMNAGK